jgi:hypothetical protein
MRTLTFAEPKPDKPQTPDLILFIVRGHISCWTREFILSIAWIALLERKRSVKMVE